ncbi:hypothetical protein [Clostridium sp.]
MAKSFKELGEKAESLIEQGNEADKKVSSCQARVVSSSSRVAAAKRQLAAASEMDDEGRPKGNVDQARAQLGVAQNQLAASQRALSSAKEEANRVKQQKNAHVQEIERHNAVERSNIEKLRRLQLSAFAGDSAGLTAGMIERLNQAEDARVSLLKSMGINAAAEYVTASGDVSADITWNGGSFSDIDLSGQMVSYHGSSGENASSAIGTPSPVGGAFSNDRTTNILIQGSNVTTDQITQEESMPISERKEALKLLRNNLINARIRSIAEQEIEWQRKCVKTLKLSDTERYEMGLRYIDNILEVYRDNLRDRGVNDGEIMERYLAFYKSQYLKMLSDDIQNQTYLLVDHELPDFDQLENNIRADQQYVPKYVITDKQRESIREGIRRGIVLEKDIRDIGRKVRGRYDELITEKHREYDLIRKQQFNLALEFKNANTSEERERVELKRKLLVERERSLSAKYNTAGMVKLVLSQYRDIGPKGQSDFQPYQRNVLSLGVGDVVRAIDNVRNYIPSDWVEKSNGKPIEVKCVQRGYFFSGNSSDIVALSGGKEHMQSCAFHEMGHRFENMYPEILKIEKQFYDRRTSNESLQWLGPGYDKSEVTRFDHFINPYMGKDYGGSGFELLSMGMEGMFCETYNISRDPEYEDLILGILVAI